MILPRRNRHHPHPRKRPRSWPDQECPCRQLHQCRSTPRSLAGRWEDLRLQGFRCIGTHWDMIRYSNTQAGRTISRNRGAHIFLGLSYRTHCNRRASYKDDRNWETAEGNAESKHPPLERRPQIARIRQLTCIKVRTNYRVMSSRNSPTYSQK